MGVLTPQKPENDINQGFIFSVVQIQYSNGWNINIDKTESYVMSIAIIWQITQKLKTFF